MKYGTCNFQVYCGKMGETVSSSGLGFDVVTKLVDGLEKQGFVVYIDNFYSSPVLFEELVKQGFGAVGTINPPVKTVQSLLLPRRITKEC